MDKIYIIEDDENIRNLLKIALEGFGYEAEGFETAEEGLERIKEEVPSLAIFDWMLPGMDGVTALNYLTEHNINSYSELESRIDETCKQFDDTADKFKSVERNLNDINILRKHISTYKALRPVYDKYVKSNNKAKFEKEHQREIILFKASHKYLSQEQTDRKLPTLESVNVQRMELEEQRQKLYTDYRKAKKEVPEIDIVKANVDAMLHTPQRSEPTRENQIE